MVPNLPVYSFPNVDFIDMDKLNYIPPPNYRYLAPRNLAAIRAAALKYCSYVEECQRHLLYKFRRSMFTLRAKNAFQELKLNLKPGFGVVPSPVSRRP